MNQTQERKAYLLNKYIDNECTEEEFRECMEHLETASDFEGFDEVLQKHWYSHEAKLSHKPNWDSMRNGILLKLSVLKRKRTVGIKYAAAIAIFMSAVVLFLHSSRSRRSLIDYETQYSAPAKTKVVILSDGSRITLNSNSHLRYPEKFIGNTREVFLQGEAYFEVIHNDSKPFVIHSGDLKTNVLGTSFNVSAYSEKQAMNVTVVTGKVAVKNEITNELAVLTRGQWVTSNPSIKNFSKGNITNPEDAIAWIDNKLIFDNVCLKDVAQRLSNKYNVEIIIKDDKLALEQITALFQAQELPDILKALTRLTHSEYIKHNNAYTIYK
jgi:transmembrane sensor